jgi:hypothetical protein
MLYVATTISKHCKKMEYSYKKHPRDHDNKNVMFIHKFEYISVIALGCLVTTTFYLPLYLYFPPPLPPQTFILLCLCCSSKSLSLANKCVDTEPGSSY